MSEEIHRPVRVAVIGAGNVGATFAYTLLISGLASEIVIIDANQKKAEGEAMDLNHAVPLTQPGRVWVGDYKDCAGAAVTVITAGAAQKPGESRLDLAARNADIFRQIVPQIVENNPNGIILVTTNPVDVLSYATWKMAGCSYSSSSISRGKYFLPPRLMISFLRPAMRTLPSLSTNCPRSPVAWTFPK